MSERETSTDYRRPYRPRPLRLANRALAALLRGPLRTSLDERSLFRAAERKCGLTDFGEPSFREPLARLLAAVEDEASLHPIGRLITRTRLVAALCTRARLEALFARHPEIAREPVARPIVILGLPRTGTTLLHRLLASDPRIRALASWEALAPAPLDGPNERQRRIAAAVRAEKALAYMAPDFFAVHPIAALAPEEDVLLLDLAFRSTVAESTLRVPSFAAWLEEQDQSPAYRYLARALQALQWQRRPDGAHGGWVLKTPHHMEWIDELDAVFPDALFVWTHRDPAEVVPSFCSMIAHGRGVFSDVVDPHEIGASWLRKGARMMDRAMDARARLGERRFVDVRYRELMKDPIGVTRAIEERAGMPWSAAVEARLAATLAVEKQHRHGVHRYRLEDFALADADVDRAFARYRDRFPPDADKRAAAPRTTTDQPTR
ncbi:MAG TPA: sulfotransferase [Polyangia bacterium]|nr:sulfotransferase [Polyangia bacterium]